MRSPPSSNGFALIASLWLIVLISVIGLEFGLGARERRLLVIRRVEEPHARGLADAGVQHARARLQALLEAAEIGRMRRGVATLDPWAEADTVLPQPVEVAGATYRVELTDPGSRLHLNVATEDELRRLLRALRIDAGQADRIAQAILDWRDPDDLHRARGAEAADYERAGRLVRPRNGPFRSLDELRHVRGVTPEIRDRVAPYLTLTGSGRVNLYSAEPPVLAALAGMTDEAVGAMMRIRRQGRRLASVADLALELSPSSQELFQQHLSKLLPRTTVDTRELEVRSVGRLESGHEVAVRGLFVRGGGHVFLVWARVER